jgi:E3 ubiquitin-protein ligase TRIP12
MVAAVAADGAGSDAVLAALTELCEALSFCTEDAGGYFPTEAAAKALVRLARGGDGGAAASPDEMLLALRAITYLCDAMPRAADAVVRHGLLPVLCSRLLAIEYLDVAEQVTKASQKTPIHRPALKPQSY